MKRWVFNVLAGVSVLICLATVAIWIASYRVSCSIYQIGAGEEITMGWRPGVLMYHRLQSATPLPPPKIGTRLTAPTPYSLAPTRGPFTYLTFAGFGYGSRPYVAGSRTGIFVIHVPCWFLILVTLGFPACYYYIVRRRRIQLQHRGHSAACGYDLRATPDRCPECGAVPAKGAS